MRGEGSFAGQAQALVIQESVFQSASQVIYLIVGESLFVSQQSSIDVNALEFTCIGDIECGIPTDVPTEVAALLWNVKRRAQCRLEIYQERQDDAWKTLVQAQEAYWRADSSTRDQVRHVRDAELVK